MLQRTTAFIYKHIFARLPFFPEKESHPWDYYAHFIVSFVIAGVLFGIFLGILALFSSKLPAFLTVRVALGAACVITLAGGIVKEVFDWRVGQRDVVPDFLGDAFGVGLFIVAALVLMNVIMSVIKMTP